MVNLKRLEYLLEKYGQQILNRDEQDREFYDFSRIPWSEWHSMREWLGLNYKFESTWYKSFYKVNEQKPDGQPLLPAFKKFCDEAVEKGPTLPNFYDENGKILFSGLSGAASISEVPIFFVDNKAILENEPGFDYLLNMVLKYYTYDSLKVALVRESEEESAPKTIYNPKLGEYEVLRSLDSATLASPAFSSLPYEFATWGNLSMLGFKDLALYPWSAYFIKNGKTYHNYLSGICKLMLLRLGLDTNNNDIGIGDSLRPVLDDMQNKMFIEKDNPWKNNFFSKDKFLQYQIADIFKKNDSLFQKAKEVADFSSLFKPVKVYSTFINDVKAGKIYRKDKQKYVYDEIEKFISGEEQNLAYIFTNIIRLLWYTSLDVNTFYDETLPKKDMRKLGLDWSIDLYKKDAFKQTEKGDSFISVWNEIVTKLKALPRKTWISFDGHGWLVSFDSRIINAQVKHLEEVERSLKSEGTFLVDGDPKVDIALLKSLGCTGIDSWKSAPLYSFYKRPRNEEQWNKLHQQDKWIKLNKIMTNLIAEKSKKEFDKQKINSLFQQAEELVKSGTLLNHREFLAKLKKVFPSDLPLPSELAEKIQKMYRGYNVRQQYKTKELIEFNRKFNGAKLKLEELKGRFKKQEQTIRDEKVKEDFEVEAGRINSLFSEISNPKSFELLYENQRKLDSINAKLEDLIHRYVPRASKG